MQKELLEERFLREDKEREIERLQRTNSESESIQKNTFGNFQKSTDSHFESKDNDTWVRVSR